MTTSPASFYDEPGLNVATYDLLYPPDMGGTAAAGDVDFYRALAAEADGPVLELGCGTGRILLALAADGIEVTGLDRSEPMLAVARQKVAASTRELARRVRLVPGDMVDFDLSGRYRLVIIAARSFQALLTTGAQRSCLAAIRRHLSSGGRLVLHLFDPLLDVCAPLSKPMQPVQRFDVIRPETATRVLISVVDRQNDPVSQTLRETWRFAELDTAGSELRVELEELRLRWSYRHEMHHLLELTGYQLEAEYSAFDRSPPRYGGELIFVARPRDR